MGRLRVLRLREHPLVEREPGQLAVDEELGVVEFPRCETLARSPPRHVTGMSRWCVREPRPGMDSVLASRSATLHCSLAMPLTRARSSPCSPPLTWAPTPSGWSWPGLIPTARSSRSTRSGTPSARARACSRPASCPGDGRPAALHPAALGRALPALQGPGARGGHQRAARGEEPRRIVRRAREEAGLDLEVVSGKEEARLICLGVLTGKPPHGALAVHRHRRRLHRGGLATGEQPDNAVERRAGRGAAHRAVRRPRKDEPKQLQLMRSYVAEAVARGAPEKLRPAAPRGAGLLRAPSTPWSASPPARARRTPPRGSSPRRWRPWPSMHCPSGAASASIPRARGHHRRRRRHPRAAWSSTWASSR